MTFLNPLVLIALAAAAIPLILHLINLRRLRTVEMSSIAFLKELRKTRIRRLRIKQLLLLMLRTLLVFLIVLAFARPTVRGKVFESVGARAKATIVFLVDDSPSMTASDNAGVYLKQACDAANEILETLESDDEVFILPLSGTSADTPPDADNRALTPFSARTLLENLKPAPIHRTLEDGLRRAAMIISASRNFVKELYVFSDFQEGAVRPAKASMPELLFPPDVSAFLVPIGAKDQHNLGIVSFRTPNAIFETGKPFAVEIGVLNASRSDVENHLVRLFLNGTRIAQRGLSIPSGETESLQFSVIPVAPGFQRLMAEIESDDLEFDNQRYVALNIPAQSRVLVLGNRASTRHITLALSAGRESGSSVEVVTSLAENVTSAMINQADAVVVANPSDLTTRQAEWLGAFVRDGGGMIVFADERIADHPSVSKALGIPLLRGIEVVGAGRDESFLEFGRTELMHPLFEGMFEEEAGPSVRKPGRVLESPRVHRYAVGEIEAGSAVILSLSNGAPFLLEETSASGRSLLFTVAPVPAWSDLPLKGLFVPLLHRAVAYCSQERAKQPSVVVGEPVRVPLARSGDDRITLASPSGAEADIRPDRGGGGILVEAVLETGFYTLRHKTSPIAMVAVNPHPDESLTRRADADATENLLKRVGIPDASTVQAAGNLRVAVMEVRHGVEIWKHLLIAAILVSLLEMLVARTTRAEVESGD